MEKMVRGRWVIIFADDAPPVFWSTHREVLEAACLHLRTTFPQVRVEWEPEQDSEDAANRDQHDE